jgi:hypothetical protein
MAYRNEGSLKMTHEMELRPRAARQARGRDRNGSTKGDVGMSPRSAQGPGNHGSFAKSIASKNGVTFKGDPMHNVGKDVPGSRGGGRY